MADQTQRAFSLSGSNVGKVRGLGPRDPNYKGTGYGPLIAGNVAEVAGVIADDPVGFAKDAAVGIYEEGKEFLSGPKKYIIEAGKEVISGAADLKNKDINARLQEKYNVTFEQATPEQVNDIRQSILSDSMTASGLIPAVGLAGVGAKAVISNVEVDPNRMGSMLGAFKRKDKPSTEVSFDPSKKPVETITFSSPISPYVETMDIPKKGITGKNFLADIRRNLKVPVRVFQDDFIDGNKRYTREELLKLVEEKQFKVKAQEQGQYSGMQRQNEAGFTYGDEQEYFFMNIAATTGAGKITPRRQHASSDDIGHVRGSIITPSVSSNFDANTETIFDVVTESKPILLAEEFQSDLYQKGYKTTNPDFLLGEVKDVFGGTWDALAEDSKKNLLKSIDAAIKTKLPTVDDYGYIKRNTMFLTNESIERTMIDAVDRGYIGGDTFDSVSFSVDRPKNIETDKVFKDAYLDPERIEKTVRRFSEKGINITLPNTESFREELFITPRVDVYSTYSIPEKSLSNTTPIADILNTDTATLMQRMSMDSETTEIFNTTTIGELNTATQEWLESLSRSAQNQGFVPSLIEDAVKNETNAERMGRGDFISADDIGGRTSGQIGDPGTISEFAEKLARKKLGLSLSDESGYPDDIDNYFKLVNSYSDVIYEQVTEPTSDFNILGKIEKKENVSTDNAEMETYIAKTARSILKYREKIVDEEGMITSHFAKFKADDLGISMSPRAIYKSIKTSTNDFQGLDAVTPPINKVKSVTDEMLKTLIVKAATSGVDKIVIPPTDRLAAVRFEDYKEYPPKFLAIMNKGLPASIQEFKKSYPEVNVSYNVEMPYDNSMYPPGSNNIPSNEGTVIDLKEFLKKYNVSPEGEVRQFAKGGLTMKDQMEMSFALGGVAETVDPVSGNDVPPGSLPEEVRDDIPARLSEGEYVVPADVVRYYGVKFFEDLRTQAKMGLTQMDADGRIGGEPMDMASSEVDIDALIDAEMNNMNAGGLISGYAPGGLAYGYGYKPEVKEIVPTIDPLAVETPPSVVTPVVSGQTSTGFTGVKTFYDAQGRQISVQFVNNKPQRSLQGLTEKNPFETITTPNIPMGEIVDSAESTTVSREEPKSFSQNLEEGFGAPLGKRAKLIGELANNFKDLDPDSDDFGKNITSQIKSFDRMFSANPKNLIGKTATAGGLGLLGLASLGMGMRDQALARATGLYAKELGYGEDIYDAIVEQIGKGSELTDGDAIVRKLMDKKIEKSDFKDEEAYDTYKTNRDSRAQTTQNFGGRVSQVQMVDEDGNVSNNKELRQFRTSQDKRDYEESAKQRSYVVENSARAKACLLYTSPSPRDRTRSRMPSSA